MTRGETFWSGKLAMVTEGASFIGSTLADQLLARAARVRIVDDLSSRHLGNIRQHLGGGKIDFLEADLRQPGVTRAAMQAVDTVFHPAADHGGRGYVDLGTLRFRSSLPSGSRLPPQGKRSKVI